MNLPWDKIWFLILITVVAWLFKQMRNDYIEKEKVRLQRVDESIKNLVRLKSALVIAHYESTSENKANLLSVINDASPYFSNTLLNKLFNVVTDNWREANANDLGNVDLLKSIDNEIDFYYSEQTDALPFYTGKSYFMEILYFLKGWLGSFIVPAYQIIGLILILSAIAWWADIITKIKVPVDKNLFLIGSLGNFVAFVIWIGIVDLSLQKKLRNPYLTLFSFLIYLILLGAAIYFEKLILGVLASIVVGVYFIALILFKQRKI